MSGEIIRTPKMLAENRTTPYRHDVKLLACVRMDEGTGDTFTESVSGGTVTAPATVDHTSEAHAPTTGIDDAISGAPDALTTRMDDGYILCFYGSIPALALGARGGIGTSTGFATHHIVGSNTSVNCNTRQLTRTTVVNNQAAFWAIKTDLNIGQAKLYDSINLGTPALVSTETSELIKGPAIIHNNIELGSETFVCPTYGLLAYHSERDFTDAEMIDYLTKFQNDWSHGHKHLIKGL